MAARDTSTRPHAELPWRSIEECGCCGDARSTRAGRMQGVDILRCETCGTKRFAEVVESAAVYADGYHTGTNEFGWNWASQAEQDYQTALADQQLAWIEQRVGRGSLLDIGGGIGHFAAAAARRGWDATLLEPVADAVEHARQAFGLTAINGTVESLGADQHYDVVSLVHCLEHLPSALDELRRIRGAIGPNGHLYVEVPNYGSIARRSLGARWQGWQAGEHVYLFERKTLLGLLRRAGYTVVEDGGFAPVSADLTVDTYAYFLGISPLLSSAVRAKRALTRRSAPATGEHGSSTGGPALDETTGARRLVFKHGFEVVRTLEEKARAATNLRVLARPVR